MGIITAKRILLLVGLIVVLCLPAAAQKRTATLRLTDADKKAIVSAVFADGFEELNAQLGGSNVLDECQHILIGDQRIAFLSTKNLDPKLVPSLRGVHFEFMSPAEIEAAVNANDKHCYFEFTRFEVVGAKVAVMFGKYLKGPGRSYGEAFKYEYAKVAGKWRGKYTGKTVVQS